MEHTEEVESSKKKRRISSACIECQKSHAKCNGENPCAKCVKQGKDCVFAEQRKRGAKCRSDREKIASLVSTIQQHSKDSVTADMLPDAVAELIPRFGLAKQRIPDFLQAYEVHLMPFFPSFDIPTFDVLDTLDKEFLFYAMLANGAVCLKEASLGGQLAQHAQVLLNHKLMNNPSVYLSQGLLLLSYYACSGAQIEKAHSFAALSYRVAQKVLPTAANQQVLTALQGRSLAKMVAFNVDNEDRDYYFSKSKRLLTNPVDIEVLLSSIVRNEIAHIVSGTSSPASTYGVLAYLDEADRLLPTVALKLSKPTMWLHRMFSIMLHSLRAAIYWKTGRMQESLELVKKATALLQQEEVTHQCIGFTFSLAYLLKVCAEADQNDLLRTNFSLLEQYAEVYVVESEIGDLHQGKLKLLDVFFEGHRKLAPSVSNSTSWKWMDLLFFPLLKEAPPVPKPSYRVDFCDQFIQSLINNEEIATDISSFLSLDKAFESPTVVKNPFTNFES